MHHDPRMGLDGPSKTIEVKPTEQPASAPERVEQPAEPVPAGPAPDRDRELEEVGARG